MVRYATDIMNGKAEAGWAGGSVPYAWGGGHGGNGPGPTLGTCQWYTGPQPCVDDQVNGVDCSGFARWVYSLAYGSDVLGAGNTDSEHNAMVQDANPTPGDLVFFGTQTNTHHVGVFIGNGQIIDAYASGTHVRVDDLSGFDALVGYYTLAG